MTAGDLIPHGVSLESKVEGQADSHPDANATAQRAGETTRRAEQGTAPLTFRQDGIHRGITNA